MSDASLEERLAAVERALTEGDGSGPVIAAPDRDVVERVESLEEDVAELEAAVQAVRGYAGSVKHVNDEVEQRADAAMAKVEALERALADDEDVTGTRMAGAVTDGCPTCADDHRRDSSTTGTSLERTGPCSPDNTAGASTHPERTKSDDGSNQRNGDRSVDGPPQRDGNRSVEPGRGATPGAVDTRSSAGDGDGERWEPFEPGRGRVGHRRLGESDEVDGLLARLGADGLLARLREVL